MALTSASVGCSCGRATVRFSSLLALLVVLLGCAPGEAPSPEEGFAAPPRAGALGAMPLGVIARLDLSSVPPLPESARLFVFARKPGERMPMAVEHFSIADAPASVSFGAQQPHAAIEVVARISRRGSVERHPSDLEALAVAVLAHPPEQVTLVLGEPLPATVGIAPSTVSVAVDHAVPVSLPGNPTVYVVARGPGSFIPLAVKSFPLQELPALVELGDGDSMLPSRAISTASTIEVSAHISLTGEAARRKGDWFGYAGPPSAGDLNRYSVTIDQPVR